MIGYWNDWRLFSLLPHGSERIADEPAWVVELFKVCEEAAQEFDSEKLKAATDG